MSMMLEQALSAIDRNVMALRELKCPEHAAELSEARDAVSAHLTQPAQSVDVGKVWEVIAELRCEHERINGAGDTRHGEWADKLTTALTEKGNG